MPASASMAFTSQVHSETITQSLNSQPKPLHKHCQLQWTWLFNLQRGTGRWQSHVLATDLPFVPKIEGQGWLYTQSGGQTLSPCSVTGTKLTQPPKVSDFQLVEDDSPVGSGELIGVNWEELVCSLSLSFTFSHIHPHYLQNVFTASTGQRRREAR